MYRKIIEEYIVNSRCNSLSKLVEHFGYNKDIVGEISRNALYFTQMVNNFNKKAFAGNSNWLLNNYHKMPVKEVEICFTESEMVQMIKGLWNQTTFTCGCHETPVPLEYNHKGKTLFYSCPKYLNHTSEERACRNNLDLKSAEKILDKISTFISENDGTDPTNYSFCENGINAKITHYTDTEMTVEIVNKRALR